MKLDIKIIPWTLLIAIIIAILIVVIYYLTTNQVNPSHKQALQTGYGWYTDPIISPCITANGRCGDDGQVTVIKRCIPHPVTLKGCKASDGSITYNSFVEYRHCNLQCIGSNISIQNAVEIYRGVSTNGITETPIHIGGTYLVDKNTGIEYTNNFIGSFNYESNQYNIKNCIPDIDNYISYAASKHECNDFDIRGPNNCYFNCNEYPDFLRQTLAYENNNPSRAFLAYPKDTNSDGSFNYRCYDIFGNNQIDIFNSATIPIPSDFVYPNICYRHFTEDNTVDNALIYPYGTDNVFEQNYPYMQNQDWFMVDNLADFKTNNPNFIDYNYDILKDYNNYILANINGERTLISKVRTVNKLFLQKIPAYIYIHTNSNNSTNAIEINTPLDTNYNNTTLILQNSVNYTINQNLHLGGTSYFRAPTNELFGINRTYAASNSQYSINNNLLTVYISDNIVNFAFQTFNSVSPGKQKMLIYVNSSYNTSFQLGTMLSISSNIAVFDFNPNTFDKLGAAQFGILLTPFLIKNTSNGTFNVTNITSSDAYNISYDTNQMFLSHLALAPEIYPGTSNPYNIIDDYSYKVYNMSFSDSNNFYENSSSDKNFYVYGTNSTTENSGYYYPLVTTSSMNIYSPSAGISIQFLEYGDFIFYFPGDGPSIRASSIPPNPDSNMIDFDSYSGVARAQINTTSINNVIYPQIPSITFPGWLQNNTKYAKKTNYFLADTNNNLIGFFELDYNGEDYAIQVIRNQSNYFEQFDSNNAITNIFTEKMRIYSNLISDVSENYNNFENSFNIIIEPQQGVLVEADFTVFRSPFMIEQGKVSSVCFDQYNRPLPANTVIQMKPNSGQQIVSYRQTPINAPNVNCGKYVNNSNDLITEYAVQNNIVIDSGACVSNFGEDFQTENLYGMDGVCLYPAICSGVSCLEPYFTTELQNEQDYYPREQFFNFKSNNHFYISKLDNNAQNKINNPNYWDEIKGLIRDEIVYNNEKFYIADERSDQIYFYKNNLPGIVGEFPLYYSTNFLYDKQFSFYSYIDGGISPTYIEVELMPNLVISGYGLNFLNSKYLTSSYLNGGDTIVSPYNITFSNNAVNSNYSTLTLNISFDMDFIFGINIGDYIVADNNFLNLFIYYSNFINNGVSSSWNMTYNFGMDIPTVPVIRNGFVGDPLTWYLLDPYDVIQINKTYYVFIFDPNSLTNTNQLPIITVNDKTSANITTFPNVNTTAPQTYYSLNITQINNGSTIDINSVDNQLQNWMLKEYIPGANQMLIESVDTETNSITTTIPYNISNSFINENVFLSQNPNYNLFGFNMFGDSKNFVLAGPTKFDIVKATNITTPQQSFGQNTLYLFSSPTDKMSFIVESYYYDNSSQAVYIREYAEDRYLTTNYIPKFNVNDKINISLGGVVSQCIILEVSVRYSDTPDIILEGATNTNLISQYFSDTTCSMNLMFDYKISFISSDPFYISFAVQYGNSVMICFKTYLYETYACVVIDDTNLISSPPTLSIASFTQASTNITSNSSGYSAFTPTTTTTVSASSISEGFGKYVLGNNNNIFLENFFMIDNFKTQNLMIASLFGTRLYNNIYSEYIEINNIEANTKPYGPTYIYNNAYSQQGYGSIINFDINTNSNETNSIAAVAYVGLIFKSLNQFIFKITDQQIATFDFITSIPQTYDIRYDYNFSYYQNEIVEYRKPDFKVYYQNNVNAPIMYDDNLISDESFYYKYNNIYYYPLYVSNLNNTRINQTFGDLNGIILYTDNLITSSAAPENMRAFNIININNVGQWSDGFKSFFNSQDFGVYKENTTYIAGDIFVYNNLVYETTQDFNSNLGICAGVIDTFSNILTPSTAASGFYTLTTTDTENNLAQSDAEILYNSLFKNVNNTPYTTYNPNQDKLRYMEITNRGLCTGVAVYDKVFNQFPNFSNYKTYMNKLIVINQGVCGVVSMPSLFYGANNIGNQGYMSEDYAASEQPYLTSYLYSMPFGNSNIKPFCTGNLEYGNQNINNIRFANAVLFYPIPLEPNSQDWYKLTFEASSGVSYFEYNTNMKYNYVISNGTCMLINSDSDNNNIFGGNVTLKRNRIATYGLCLSGFPTSLTFNVKQPGGVTTNPITLIDIEYNYLPFFESTLAEYNINLNNGDIWYVSDENQNILSHGVMDITDGYTNSELSSVAVYKYPDYAIPATAKLYFKTTANNYTGGVSIIQKNNIGNNYLNYKQITNFKFSGSNPFTNNNDGWNFYQNNVFYMFVYVDNIRGNNSFSIWDGGTSISFDSTSNTSDNYYYLLDSTSHLKIKMFGYFYNEDMASITYQNQIVEVDTNGTCMSVMSFTPYRSQFLVNPEERSITWGLAQQAVEINYPNYFDVFDLQYKAANSFGLCAIAYNKPLSSSSKLLNLNNFVNPESNITNKIGVVVTNSTQKIIASAINLNNTMNVIGTIDEIVNTVNPYSPQSEYYNSLRRGLFPNRADMDFANNCFAYYSTMTSQNFPSGPTIPLFLNPNNQAGVSGYSFTDIIPTLYNVNTYIDQSSSTMNSMPLVFSTGEPFINNIIDGTCIINGTSVIITYYIDGFVVNYDSYHDNSIYNSYASTREVDFLAIAPYGEAPPPITLYMGTSQGGQFTGTSVFVVYNYSIIDSLFP